MKKIITTDGYYFNEDSEKLEKFELIKVVTCMSEGACANYHCKLGGVSTILHEGPQEYIEIYENEEQYRLGTPMKKQEIPTHFLCNEYFEGRVVWAFIGGKATMVEVPAICVTFEKGEGYYVTDGTKYYTTHEEVYKYNDYIVKEADGSERVVVCLANKMSLTPEQKVLVEEFQSLAKRMEDAKMKLEYDIEGNELIVYNANTPLTVTYYGDDASGEDVTMLSETLMSNLGYISCDDKVRIKAEK